MTLPDDIALRLAVCGTAEPLPTAALSGEERDRLAGFGSEKRCRAFALGRATARSLVAERLGIAPAAVPLRVAADGAPEVDGADLSLSLSHVATETQTLAAVALAERRVGVDLELIRPRRPDLYRFLLAPEDYGVLDGLGPHDEAQVLVWTVKEAVLKALRTGFRLSPKKLRLDVPETGRAVIMVEGGTAWEVRFERREGCFLAVAFQP